MDLVAGRAPTTGQLFQAALGDEIGQMTGGGGLGDLGDRLILRGADAVLESAPPALVAVEQAIEDLDLLRARDLLAVAMPKRLLASTRSICADADSMAHSSVARNQCSHGVRSRGARAACIFWAVSS